MGRELYATQPVFAAAFDEAGWYLDLQLDRPLADALADEELLGRTEYAQPAIFAVEVALLALVRHWGLTPDVLVGHSIGEIAAAYAAGVLSLADAAALVARARPADAGAAGRRRDARRPGRRVRRARGVPGRRRRGGQRAERRRGLGE